MPHTGQPDQDEECTTDGMLILSYGWLYNWKRRHGVFSVHLHGEAVSADQRSCLMLLDNASSHSVADIQLIKMGSFNAFRLSNLLLIFLPP